MSRPSGVCCRNSRSHPSPVVSARSNAAWSFARSGSGYSSSTFCSDGMNEGSTPWMRTDWSVQTNLRVTRSICQPDTPATAPIRASSAPLARSAASLALRSVTSVPTMMKSHSPVCATSTGRTSSASVCRSPACETMSTSPWKGCLAESRSTIRASRFSSGMRSRSRTVRPGTSSSRRPHKASIAGLAQCTRRSASSKATRLLVCRATAASSPRSRVIRLARRSARSRMRPCW